MAQYLKHKIGHKGSATMDIRQETSIFSFKNNTHANKVCLIYIYIDVGWLL